MASCTRCGSIDQFSRYCVDCGAEIAGASSDQADRPIPADLTDAVLRSGPTVGLLKDPQNRSVGRPYPPTASLSGPPPPSPYSPASAASTSKPPIAGRGWLIASLVFVAVVAVATTALLVLQPWGKISGVGAVVDTGLPSAAAPPSSPGLSGGGPTAKATVSKAVTSPGPTATATAGVPAPDTAGRADPFCRWRTTRWADLISRSVATPVISFR